MESYVFQGIILKVQATHKIRFELVSLIQISVPIFLTYYTQRDKIKHPFFRFVFKALCNKEKNLNFPDSNLILKSKQKRSSLQKLQLNL